jgi:uncharacterized protein with beta-barrel porin domain
MNIKTAVTAVLALLCLGFALGSGAQTGPIPPIVNSRPGFTEFQRNTGLAVQRACLNINSIVPPANQTADQQDFKRECDKMVSTAFIVLNDPRGNPNSNVGTTEDSLRTVLQQVAVEEMAANSKSAIEASSRGFRSAIGGRLGALRAGSRGLALNGIDLDSGRKSYAAHEIFGREQHGGAASADAASAAPGRLGTFINATYNRGDKDTTDREDGFDYDNWSLLGGADYRITDNFVAGGALGYNQTKVDIVQSQGNIDTKAVGVSAYATYYIEKFYLDGHLSYFKNDYDSTRRIAYTNLPEGSRNANGSTKGNQHAISFGGGYDFGLGALTLAPYGRIEYLKLKIDAFDESGAQGLNVHIDEQDIKSLQSAAGGRVSYAISTGFGVIIPQVGLEWNHEFQNDSRSVTARFINDPQNNLIVIPTENPDRDYFTFNLGVSGVFKNGFSAFANFETVQGLSNITHQAIMLGARKEW